MSEKRKIRQARRRLMAGVFCVSLLLADLASAIPVWAQETVVAEQTQSFSESELDETINLEEENQEEAVQNPDDNNSVEDEESQPQNPDEGDDGNNAQNPDEEDDVTNDTAEETDLPEEEEPTDAEETDSVSENDLDGQGEVCALADSGDNIASGTYGNITWVIDANGKLTVEGTGEFAELSVGGNNNQDYMRVPWRNYASQIKSAKISVSGMTDASHMFYMCNNLTSVDFSGFDTSTVTNMENMFLNCSSLTSVDLSSFKTAKVTNMAGMFSGFGTTASKLNLSGFDTGNVTTMHGMFNNCKVTELDVSSFNTANVENMANMFSNCRNLKSLNLSNFNTDKVTRMDWMFAECQRMTKLNVTGFHTANVVTMEGMFSNCAQLTELDVHSFDTSRVETMRYMFRSCGQLTGLDLHHFNTANVTDMDNMFAQCYNLTTLNVRGFDTSKVTKMPGMFFRCQKIKNLDVSSFNTEKVKDMSTMFADCSSLQSLDLRNFNTSAVKTSAQSTQGLVNMFRDCSSLTSLDISGFDISNTDSLKGMFLRCSKLTHLDLRNFDTANITNISEMFSGCSSLTSLDLSSFNFVGVTNANGMFTSCSNVETIYTPYNVKVNAKVMLPTKVSSDIWYRSDDKTEIKTLPEGLDHSIMITRNKVPEAVARITVWKSKTAYTCGETLNTDDLTVTYYGADGSVRKLTAKQGEADGYTTNASDIDMTEPGEKKLIVTYQTGDKSLTAEITLTVTYGLTADSTTITLSEDSYTYDGKAKTPKPTVARGSGQTTVQLTEGIDYSVSYKNNINAWEQPETGTGASGSAPTVIITGTGDYSGTVTKTFTIVKAAAPAPEEKTVIASRCTQANPNRTADLSGSFASCGKKTGYEVLSVEDPNNIFTRTPVTADIQNGVLTYGTNAAQENDTASVKIKVSFANYEDAELMVKVFMSEEGVVYTVDFDLMGHGSNFTKRGIKAGSLLALSADELTPAAEGYLFTGWYRDKSFAAKSVWNFDTDTVQSDLTLYARWLTAASADGGLQLCVQEIPDLTYTGSAQKPAVTVYDSDGETLLKAGKDYTVKYVNNTNAVKIGTDGKPEQGGGTAKVENPGKANETITHVIKEEPFSKELPYVVISGKGNYTETIYRNFHIFPADISDITLKYTDQFEAKAGKTAKIVSSIKYKKALKEGSDYAISVQEENGTPVTLTQGKLPLNAGIYELVITGTGNYTGTVRRSLYVADKKNLMKNASVTYTKTIQAKGAEDLKRGIEQPDVTVKISGKPVDAVNYTIDYAGTNHAVGTATMTITGTNGYVGSKSVTFKITGRTFSAKTVEVKSDDGSIQDGSGWKAVMTYTGRALTQNKVTLTTKVDRANPTARELTYGEDYTITYKNNVKKGTAAMTFTAKPESGFSGSFNKNFKINAQELSAEMFVEKLSEDAVYSAGGATLDFRLKNAEGMELKQGTDFTVSYKDNKAATKENANSAVKAGSKQPVMTIKGKGSYAGTLTVQFQIIPASIDSAQLTVTAAQVQKKSGMKLKDFKLKVTDGKTVLKAGKDYTIDESGCTPEIIQAYADSIDRQGTAGAGMPTVPKVVLKGMGNYGMQGESAGDITKEISLADYIYATKLTSKNLKVEVTGSTTYTGRNVEPTVKVSYYKDNNAAKQDGIGVELTKGTDYKVTYGSKNIPAGKKKGSITITGAGIYGGSVTVKFDIDKKAIY